MHMGEFIHCPLLIGSTLGNGIAIWLTGSSWWGGLPESNEEMAPFFVLNPVLIKLLQIQGFQNSIMLKKKKERKIIVYI